MFFLIAQLVLSVGWALGDGKPDLNGDFSADENGDDMPDGGTVYLEAGFSDETIKALKRMGHRIGATEGGFGGYQAIFFDAENGVYIGASEARKDGHAAGY